MEKVELAKFSNKQYMQAGLLRRISWFIVSMLIFRNPFLAYSYFFKAIILRLFGAQVGKGLVIKPSVNIRCPWFLEIGDNVWLGEGVLIENFSKVKLGNNVCLSQGAALIGAGHDYKKAAFDLLLYQIIIEDGVWIAARAIVCGNVKCASHAVLTVGSVATHNLEPYKVYQGNPAVVKRERAITV
ncbi:MAG: colanic acid biosynthesis acetyltransferase WcaF [Candidatus Omnitrophica bacterium]|nr:colanic acid biosynthesis acetyltransferase WcaF [Candidatus Omnitrophota bacterium]